MLRTWQFWPLLSMSTLVNTAGLTLTAKIVSLAQQFGLSAAIATASAMVLALMGGISRITMGALSDRVDRRLLLG